MLMLLLACAHTTTPAVPEAFTSEAPVLPAPVGTMYATGRTIPRDNMVAKVVLGLPWDEVLSGAAGALAINDVNQPTLGAARWAAYRAGYPYPIDKMIMGRVPREIYPTDLAETLAAQLGPQDTLGLARARVDGAERWVALIARPQGQISPFPREIRRGEAVEIETAHPARYIILSPEGIVQEGTTPVELRPNEDGEWWLELYREDTRFVSVPFFVNMTTPIGPVIDLPGAAVAGPTEAASLAFDLLVAVRDEYGLPPVTRDSTLDTLAVQPLNQVLLGSWDRQLAIKRLQRAGFMGGPALQVTCAAETVASCIDRLLHDVDDRSAVLHPGVRVAGTAAEVRANGVTVVLNMASE